VTISRRRAFRKRAASVASIFLFAALCLATSEPHEVTGVLLQVDRKRQTISVSCRETPGYMDAMVMLFPVRDAKALDGLEPGMTIDFSLVVEGSSSHAENVHIRPFESLELDPTQARRFKLMEDAMVSKSTSSDALRIGQRVPDFTLIDQNRERISLSQFAGKVVAITFIYTRCPRPDYCVRLSNNFGLLQKRFKGGMGRDLVLLTVVIDSAHDQPEAISNYARIWKADGRFWHFLTGPLLDIQKLCRSFDMAFYPDEALFVHSFHTVIIGRNGELAANLEGNEFTAQQLGDLVQTVMAQGIAAPEPSRE
jgi:protein SCO1